MLDEHAAICVFQSVVCILCGDTNLDQNAADAVCQIEKGEQDFNSSWHAVAGPNCLSVEGLWAKGAETESSYAVTSCQVMPTDKDLGAPLQVVMFLNLPLNW